MGRPWRQNNLSMSGSGPNYGRIKRLNQPRSFAEKNRNEGGETWNKTLSNPKNKYPDCLDLKEKLFSNCPDKKEVKDVNNPPISCKSCSQREKTAQELKDRILSVMSLYKKK